jgi:DNA polymerase-3 subunit beta
VWAVEFDNNIARDNVEFTIPAGSVRLLLKCIALEGTGTDDCKIQLTESGLWISMNTFDVYTRLLEGQYPNYRQLIPVKFDHKITVGRKELVNALSRIAVVVEKNNNIVTLKVDSASQSVIATADVADVGSGQEVVAADCASSDLEFAMNLVYMMEAVKSFSSDNTVYICGNTRTAPFVIRGENTKNVAIVMPVQIRK